MTRMLCMIAAVTLLSAGLVSAQVPQTGTAPRATKHISQPAQQKPASNNWLLDADSDADRFRKLQIYLRGFDQPMWEVGQRYLAVHQAIGDQNWELADYHWDKIKLTLATGLMKRPARTANTEGMFLDGVWGEMDRAIKSKDYAAMKTQFATVRQVCMACHVAEKVPFMNNSPVFLSTEKFARP